MKVGVLGSGVVATVLASGFLKHGHEVKVGTGTAGKLAGWLEQNAGGSVGSFAEAAEFGDLLILAVKGTAAAEVLLLAGSENLAGKAVADTTNPIADLPPENGVLKFFTGPNESLMEQLQRQFPAAHFVKAFSSVGNVSMVNPTYTEGKPTMFICGDNESAKKTVSGILDEFGWETADMGTAEAARAIEPLCMLWCIRGFAQNKWDHAFKMLT